MSPHDNPSPVRLPLIAKNHPINTLPTFPKGPTPGKIYSKQNPSQGHDCNAEESESGNTIPARHACIHAANLLRSLLLLQPRRFCRSVGRSICLSSTLRPPRLPIPTLIHEAKKKPTTPPPPLTTADFLPQHSRSSWDSMTASGTELIKADRGLL
jgi:hypothetical protein